MTTEALSPASLWRHADFLKLWAAQAVSSIGARITREGLPFAAIVSLGASPAQIGLLAAVIRAPAILVGLTAGGFVDRRRRRPVMIGSDIGRAVVLASVPLAAWLHILSLNQLYLVAVLVGAMSVLFDLADHAYLPGLVDKRQLVDGNAKLATTDAVAEIGGPALYGILFQLFTAPIAIAVNAGTYLFSALALALIKSEEVPPKIDPAAQAAHFVTDFRLGLAAALADPAIRRLLLITTAAALFGAFFSSLYLIQALRILHLTPSMLGTTVAVGGVAALFGAATASRVIARLGLGPAFVWTGILAAASSVFVPLAHGSPVTGMLMLMVAQLLGDSIGTVTEIAGRSLRQSLIAPELMGRVGGVFALAPGITGIVGALVGGALGSLIGTQNALYIASAGLTLAALLGLGSPLMRRLSPN